MTEQVLDEEPSTSPDPDAVPDVAAPTAPGAPGEPRASWARRAATRVVRRPRDWAEAPWPAERIVRVLTAVALVGGSTFAALRAVHPDLILTNNTPTGGDMGAHVMGPAFLRDHLLPNLQLTGWSNYWYDGFPMYRFYMVIPALMIVALNVLLPYGIAFKIVAVLGIVTLPVCCWAFGRLGRFRYPMPELFGVAALLFLFDESFSIYGGNVKSTMAGEFSFSIALSLGMLGLGLLARGLETGRHRVKTAIVVALACLCHGIVLIFVLLGAVLLWLVWLDRRRAWYGFSTLLTAGLLMSFWVVPFLFDHAYMTDMKYGFRPDGPNDSFWDMFFPLTTFFDIFITTFAVIGFVASIVRRHLNGAWLGICTLALVAGVYVTRDSLPVIGLLWNPRLLPFIYLLRYLLMMVGIVETVVFVARALRDERELVGLRATYVGTATAVVVGLAVLLIELMFFRIMPGAGFETHNGKTVYQWGPIALTSTSTDALSDAWPRYNFTGYEEKDAYGEYKALIDTMAALGADPDEGCGRALWENNSENGKYGTTMALMLLPHWTDGCIASSEGLFFEASGTTPYHFVTAAAMSASSSNPVRQLRYDNNDASVGVPYLQTLGIRYAMVFTQAAKDQADLQPELTLVAQSGPWNIYRVAGSELVQPLAVQPVVVDRRPGDPRERNLELGMSWFQHRDEWAAIPADDGPDSWQRVEVAPDLTRRQDDRVDIIQPAETIEPVDLTPVTVSNVDLGEQDLSFDVSEPGVPVLVKVSYFPNWEVRGAEGPYRIAPNLMVVVPTSTHVQLEYARSSLDLFAYLLSAVGIGLLVLWRLRGDVEMPTPAPGSAPWPASDGDATPAAIPSPWAPLGPEAGGWPSSLDLDVDVDADPQAPEVLPTTSAPLDVPPEQGRERWGGAPSARDRPDPGPIGGGSPGSV